VKVKRNPGTGIVKMLLHQKLWLVHSFNPFGFTEYHGPDIIHSESPGYELGYEDGDTFYWVVIPNVMRGEFCEEHLKDSSGAEIVHFDSREEALVYLRDQHHVYLEGAPIYDENADD
jgi:hypothetical protein